MWFLWNQSHKAQSRVRVSTHRSNATKQKKNKRNPKEVTLYYLYPAIVLKKELFIDYQYHDCISAMLYCFPLQYIPNSSMKKSQREKIW
jgi:hypothetical protein